MGRRKPEKFRTDEGEKLDFKDGEVDAASNLEVTETEFDGLRKLGD